VELPSYVQIEPVGQCNLRCEMCPIQFRAERPPAFMPFETYTRLIDQFPRLRELHLQGLGEPLMHPRFFDMVAYAVGRGITVTTNTNLTLLTRKRAERCVASGLSALHGSIDGAKSATYERIRRRGRFARIVANLAHLVEARERAGGGQPRIQIVMVIMRQNLRELPALVRFTHAWGADSLFVQHLSHDFAEADLPAQYAPMRAFVENETLLREDVALIEAIFAEARALATELGVDLRLPRARPRPHPPGTPGRTRCDWPWRGAYLSYDGQAMPCCMVATPDRASFGNMADAGVERVWNNDAYTHFRARLDSPEPPEICRSCALYAGTF
jgi:radical SAM protein with 4Fe4S-binding SPASM domain